MRTIMFCALMLVSGIAAAAVRASPGQEKVDRTRVSLVEAVPRGASGLANRLLASSCEGEIAPFDAEGHLLETRLAIAAESSSGESSCLRPGAALRPALSIRLSPACDRDRRTDLAAEVLLSTSTFLRAAGEAFQLESVSPELVIVSLRSDLEPGRLDALASSLVALEASTDVALEEGPGETEGSSGPSP
jgi:hypothetical protein